MKKKRDIMNPVIGVMKPSISPPNPMCTTSLSPLSNHHHPISFNSNEAKDRRKEKKGFDFANLAKSVLDEDGDQSKVAMIGHHPTGLLSKAIDRMVSNGTSNGHPNPSLPHPPPSNQGMVKNGHPTGQPGSVSGQGLSGHLQLPAAYHDYLQKQLAFFAAASAASAAHFIPGFPFPSRYVSLSLL